MTKKNTPTASYREILEQVNEGIKAQANRPNLYAYTPHDKQYMFHKSDAKVILYIGGNRSGKTTGGAVETIYRLMGRHPYKVVPPAPVRGRACAVDFNYGVDMIMLPEIKRWMPPSFLKNGSWEDSYDKEHRVLTLANKSFLEFRSYDQDLEKFAGTSRHFNWFDEEPPKHIYNESQARLIDTDGDAYLTMTPVEGMSWVFGDIYQPGIDNKPGYFVVEIDMKDNPHITEEAAERYLATLDPEERKARESGEFVAMGGRIFKSFSPVLHVVPFEIPPKNWEWYTTIDHGYNNPTAILWHAVSPNNQIVTFAEHYVSEMIVSDHAKAFHERNKGMGKRPDVIIGDPAMSQRTGVTGTSILQEYADNGVYISTERTDVDSGLNKMIQYLKEDPALGGKPRWTITENCPNIINEMRKYRWATYSSRKQQFEKNRQEKPHKKDDHAIDSTRYLFTFMPDLTTPNFGGVPERVGNPLGAGKSIPVGGGWDEHARVGSKNTQWKQYAGTDLYALEY